MKRTELRRNKGITLIALVITIIVMLILVAVTITMAVNGGLFDYAGRAAQDTEIKKQEELDYINVPSGGTYENLIDKYTTSPGETKYGLSEDGETFIGKKSITNRDRRQYPKSKLG